MRYRTQVMLLQQYRYNDALAANPHALAGVGGSLPAQHAGFHPELRAPLHDAAQNTLLGGGAAKPIDRAARDEAERRRAARHDARSYAWRFALIVGDPDGARRICPSITYVRLATYLTRCSPPVVLSAVAPLRVRPSAFGLPGRASSSRLCHRPPPPAPRRPPLPLALRRTDVALRSASFFFFFFPLFIHSLSYGAYSYIVDFGDPAIAEWVSRNVRGPRAVDCAAVGIDVTWRPCAEPTAGQIALIQVSVRAPACAPAVFGTVAVCTLRVFTASARRRLHYFAHPRHSPPPPPPPPPPLRPPPSLAAPDTAATTTLVVPASCLVQLATRRATLVLHVAMFESNTFSAATLRTKLPNLYAVLCNDGGIADDAGRGGCVHASGGPVLVAFSAEAHAERLFACYGLRMRPIIDVSHGALRRSSSVFSLLASIFLLCSSLSFLISFFSSHHSSPLSSRVRASSRAAWDPGTSSIAERAHPKVPRRNDDAAERSVRRPCVGAHATIAHRALVRRRRSVDRGGNTRHALVYARSSGASRVIAEVCAEYSTQNLLRSTVGLLSGLCAPHYSPHHPSFSLPYYSSHHPSFSLRRPRSRPGLQAGALHAHVSPPTRTLIIYRYISRESCSQFDSLPLTSLTLRPSPLQHPHPLHRSLTDARIRPPPSSPPRLFTALTLRAPPSRSPARILTFVALTPPTIPPPACIRPVL